MPRYRRHFAPGQIVFLTLVCAGRRPWLGVDGVRVLALDALRDTRQRHPFRHLGHALLDDDLHLLLAPAAGTQTPRLVGSFKRALQARLAEPAGAKRLWQRRYYDHIIRDADDLARHLDYIHYNPVKHGLVAQPAEWPWSSFPAWRARGVYAADWGRVEPAHLAGMDE